MVVSVNQRKFYFLLFVPLCINLCCKSKDKNYLNLYHSANKNKGEIEKIINFYKEDFNPERRIFMEFLLETLPYQYQLEYSIIDSSNNRVVLRSPIPADSIDHLRYNKGYVLSIDTLRTLEHINAKFLIDQINIACEIRNKCDWAKKIPIDRYCQFVLPYQINNEKPFDYKRFYMKRYLSYIDDVLVKHLNTFSVLHHYLNSFFQRANYPSVNCIDFTSSLTITEIGDGNEAYTDMEDVAVLNTHALRSLGIPCAYEFTPYLANIEMGEIIVNIMDSVNSTKSPSIYKDFYKYRVAKFYRNVFDLRLSKNPYRELLDFGISQNDIPFTLNVPKVVDITSEKTTTSNISVEIEDDLLNNKVLYLCMGTGENWKVVSYGKVNKKQGNVIFKNMGVKVLYHLSSYKEGKTTLIGQPFIIDTLGRRKNIIDI